MTDAFFDATHGARRALHRNRPGREGVEAELVSRLTEELEPASARRTLARCLDGELSPPAALSQLLVASGSVAAVRALVDEITARADADSRAGDSLVRDRADALTRLFVENEGACARALARGALAATANAEPGGADDGMGAGDAAVDEEIYFERVLEALLRAGAPA